MTREPWSSGDTEDLAVRSESELFDRHLGLVGCLGRAHAGRDLDCRTFEVVARAALRKAVGSFDRRNGSFVPFATSVILVELRRHRRESYGGSETS